MILACASITLPSLSGCKESASTQPAGKTLKIAVIPKGLTHEFWKSIHAGAIKAQRELTTDEARRELGIENVEIVWKGPAKEDDRNQQITLVENFIVSRMDGIVLAPLSDEALAAPVRQAGEHGVAVVIIDSGLKGEAGKDFVSFVATDNYKGGVLAGRRLGKLLDGNGRALLLRYAEGSASTTLREAGFVDTLKKEFPRIELIDPPRYAGADRSTALQASENLLAGHSNIDGIFAPNESSTAGMLLALKSRRLAGKVKFIGFDASPDLVKALTEGELHGLVLQNPLNMGYLGVKTLVAHLAGKKVDTRIDTGVALATKDNMDEPEIAAVLNPDLSMYLGE